MDHLQEQTGTYPPISPRDLELLSAFLDGELTERERATLEARMQKEPALRHHLEELRATVSLVKQLPQLPLPRSFTLQPEPEALMRSRFVPRHPRINWIPGNRIWAGSLLVLLLSLVSLTTLLIALDRLEQSPSVGMVASQPRLPDEHRYPEGEEQALLVATNASPLPTGPHGLVKVLVPTASPAPLSAANRGAQRGGPGGEDQGGVLVDEQSTEHLTGSQQLGETGEYSGGSPDDHHGVSRSNATSRASEIRPTTEGEPTSTPPPTASPPGWLAIAVWVLLISLVASVVIAVWFLRKSPKP